MTNRMPPARRALEAIIVRFLASQLSNDDRAAMALHRGYRPPTWDPSAPRPFYDPTFVCSRHSHRGCLTCDCSPHLPQTQPFESVIDAHVDRLDAGFSLALRQRLWRVVAELRWIDAFILDLCAAQGWSFYQVAKFQPTSPAGARVTLSEVSVARHYHHAMDRIINAISADS